MKEVVYIYLNPTAGSGRASQIWNNVQPVLRERHIVYQLFTDVSTLPIGANIIVIGGDGTFNTLLNTLTQPELYRFILLPAGTSNSLCSQISPKESWADKLQRYLNGDPFQSIDLGLLTIHQQSYRFVNEASVGFAAAIALATENGANKRFFNRLHLNELGYIATAFQCWATERPYMLSFCNNRRISGNLYPCPNAKINDQQIDSYELTCPRIVLPFELTRLVNAHHNVQSSYVRFDTFATKSFHFEEPLPVEMDGNPLPSAKEVIVSVYPQPIAVL